MNKMAVLAAAAAIVVAAAALLSSQDAGHVDVAVLEIGGGDGGRVELVPVDAGAAGTESLAFDGAGGGPYAGVSDGRVLRWVPGERRWEEHSSSCAPELEVSLAALLAAAALLLSSLDSRSDVSLLEIGHADIELLPLDAGAVGPESFVFADDGDGDGDGGGLFTGVSDGRVLRWVPAERRWAEHSSSAPPHLLDSCRGSQDPSREHECGRPLGLKFNHDTGELYVADAYHGLRVVSPDDKVSTPVAPQWWQGTGRAFSFANAVELDPETGFVYFTETSTRYQRREFLRIVISGDTTGRLLRYDPNSGKVEVLVDGLAFPNGLAVSRDGTHLLLAETTTGRILRYWLRPAAKALEEVARLPWFPDNVRMSPRGGFWVGLHAKRGKLAEWCISYPWLRRLLLSLPPRHVQRASWLLNRLGRQVIAVRLSEEDGKVMEMVSVHGDLQKVFRSVSEVEERNGSLWIGSVMSPFLGVYKLQ